MPKGLYITRVEPGSSAHLHGIQDGDLLLSINDHSIATMDELKSVIFNYEVGDTVQAVIYRGGQRYLVELTLSEAKG